MNKYNLVKADHTPWPQSLDEDCEPCGDMTIREANEMIDCVVEDILGTDPDDQPSWFEVNDITVEALREEYAYDFLPDSMLKIALMVAKQKIL